MKEYTPNTGDIPDLPLTADDEPDDDSKAETESILAKVWLACDNRCLCVCHLDALKSQKHQPLPQYGRSKLRA